MGIEGAPEQLPSTQDIADPILSAEHRGEGLSEDELPSDTEAPVRPQNTTLDMDEISFQEESDPEQQSITAPQHPATAQHQEQQIGERTHLTTLDSEELPYQDESEAEAADETQGQDSTSTSAQPEAGVTQE